MSEPDLPPLDDELRSLLRDERARPSVPPTTRARVLSRVEASIAVAAVGVAAGATAASLVKGSAAKTWIVAALAFSIGGAVGAGTMYFVARGAQPPVVVEKRVEVPVAVPAPAPVPSTTAAPVPTPTTSLATAPTIAVPKPAASDGSKEEHALIETIRSALQRGDCSAALASVHTHETKFPNGKQVEEREASAVQALARCGRLAEARERADRFRKRFPKSLYTPVLEAAIGANP